VKPAFDAIVIGAGHNGLTNASYLARSGARVVVVEKNGTIGGCAADIPFGGGYIGSLPRMLSTLRTEVIEELQLRRYGLRIVQRDPALSIPVGRSNSIRFWFSLDRTESEIRRVSKKDSRAFHKFALKLRARDRFFEKFIMMPYPPTGEVISSTLDSESPDLALFLRTPPIRLAEEYFETPELQGLAAVGAMEGALCDQPRALLGYSFGVKTVYGYPVGGMGRICRALFRSAKAKGVSFEIGDGVKKILVRQGMVHGVRLESGRELRSRVVISSADPKTTFLRMLGPADVTRDFLRRVRRIDVLGYRSKIMLGLSAPPRWSFSDRRRMDAPTTLICPSLDVVRTALRDFRAGRIPDHPILFCGSPGSFDTSQAPKGKLAYHVYAIYTPYRKIESEEYDLELFDKTLATMREFIPGIDALIECKAVFSPARIEAEYNVWEGDGFHGSLDQGQLYGSRPTSGYGSFGTPVKGLYLCGSGCHPGGGITGAPGRLAAIRVLSETGVGRGMAPRQIE
jgi:phytoene dehydrogenase-like protein